MQDNRIQATLTAEEAIDFVEKEFGIKLLNYQKVFFKKFWTIKGKPIMKPYPLKIEKINKRKQFMDRLELEPKYEALFIHPENKEEQK